MATIKHIIKKNRPKAFLGADGALMAAAIGLQTANDTVNAIMQAKQASRQADNIRQSARDQQKAIETQTQLQTRAMAQTNDNNNRLTEKTIESNKELYGEQTDVMKQINTNMLLAQGQANADERKAASKLVVKKGGSIRRKLRNTNSLPVRNSTNMPFIVTDGGGVLPLGQTPEGYDLYEIIGNDHKHYHKTKEGKQKSGVGFKFEAGGEVAGGEVEVEGEGNQSSSTGELMLVTPDDAMFISKHSINGFNPTKAVLAGMHPIDAFNIQELNKTNYYPKYNGRKIAALGINIYDQQPGITTDTIQARSRVLNESNVEDYLNNGYNVMNGQLNQTDLSRTNAMKAKRGCSLKRIKAEGGTRWKDMNDLQKLGVIGGVVNGLGAVGNTISNIIGSNSIIDANNYAAGILGEVWDKYGEDMEAAWMSRKGIDESIISDEDYNYTPAVAAIRTARVNKNADLENLRRQEAAEKNLATRESLSSAKRSILRGQINDKYNSLRNQVYQEQDNQEEQIKQENAQMSNQMSMSNAELQQRAKQNKTAAQLELAKYNNDIANENIMGAADAETMALLNKTGIYADTSKANASSRSSMGLNIANTWNNALQTTYGNFTNLYGVLSGAEPATLQYIQNNYPLFGKRSNTPSPYINTNSPVEEQKKKLEKLRNQRPVNSASIINPNSSLVFMPNYQPIYPF